MSEPKQISIAVMKQMLQQQREDFSAMLTGVMNSFNERYDKLRVTVTEIRVSLEYSQQEIAAMKETVNLQDKAHKMVNNEVSILEENLNEIEGTIDYLENQSRRNNVIFDGVPEHEKETWQESEGKVLDIIENRMDLDSLTIERAHRVGRVRSQRGRPIVVKFLNFKDRDAVLRNGKKLKGTSFYVREDLSEKVLAKRRVQMPQFHEARENGKIAYFNYDRLIIKDRQRQLSSNETRVARNDAENVNGEVEEACRTKIRSQSTQDETGLVRNDTTTVNDEEPNRIMTRSQLTQGR